MEEKEIRIDEIFKILRKRWKVIFSFTLIATLFAAIMSFYIITPQYKSSIKFFIGKEIEGNDKYSANDIQVYQKFINTYAELLTTNDLVENAINNYGLSNTNSSKIISGLTVKSKADTQILEVSYVSYDRLSTKKVLDSISSEFIDEAEQLIPNGEVKVIQSSSIPDKPISPNKASNIAIGLLAGVLLGIFTALWVEYMNNDIKNETDIEEIVGIPVIGLIPKEK